MLRVLIIKVALLVAVSILPTQLFAAIYYVDSEFGDDSNSGLSESESLRSVSRTNSLSLSPGDSVRFRRSQSFDGTLELDQSGVGSAPISVGAWGSGENPIIYGILIRGDYVVVEEVIVDHRKDASDAIRIRGGKNCVLRNLEIRNGTRDA